MARHGFWGDAFRLLIRNRMALIGGIFIILMALTAIFAPWIAPKDYAEGNLVDNYAKPGSRFLLGADFMGRDLLSRIIYGARVSLTVGVVGATMATIIGMAYGSISGYYGGRVDNWMMRFVDLMYGMPTLLLIILLMVFFRGSATGPETNAFFSFMKSVDDSIGGMFFIFVGIALTSWLTMARLVRGQILSLKEREFVDAARAVGAGHMRIMTVHLLPNFLGPVIVAETLNIPTYILFEAFLSFIGLGVNPPMPSWGSMINEGIRGVRSYPHLVLFPSIALSLTLLAFNFLGDGLRDALDPRMR
ncbi:MAG: ABC transporter permease [Chloroflexi bacterium]|nr:ABC transporter permease [Chloroflexota bacterium]